MEEFTVNERTARHMARALEDVFSRIDVVTDGERRRRWSLREVDYIRHRGFRDSEIAALDLAIRRAEGMGLRTRSNLLPRCATGSWRPHRPHRRARPK